MTRGGGFSVVIRLTNANGNKTGFTVFFFFFSGDVCVRKGTKVSYDLLEPFSALMRSTKIVCGGFREVFENAIDFFLSLVQSLQCCHHGRRQIVFVFFFFFETFEKSSVSTTSPLLLRHLICSNHLLDRRTRPLARSCRLPLSNLSA